MQVLAVDGGQSAIRMGYPGGSAPLEIDGVSRQEGDIIGSVAAAIVQGWRSTGAPRVDRAVLGLTTAPSDGPSQRHLCAEVASGIAAGEVWLADDAVTSHAGALSLEWGVSITAGTGVACLAMPREGRPSIIGGHGYLFGDEGGAWWIGREGIRAVLRAADGRAPATGLTERAERHFGGLHDVAERLHGVARPVDTIAWFAPMVLALADEGDAVATAIAEEATDELVTLIGSAASTIGRGEAAVPVALGGRLLRDGPLRGRLDAAIAQRIPSVEGRSADGPPLEGALLLGESTDPGRYRDLVYVWGTAA